MHSASANHASTPRLLSIRPALVIYPSITCHASLHHLPCVHLPIVTRQLRLFTQTYPALECADRSRLRNSARGHPRSAGQILLAIQKTHVASIAAGGSLAFLNISDMSIFAGIEFPLPPPSHRRYRRQHRHCVGLCCNMMLLVYIL